MAREVVYLNLNWFVDECRDDFMKFSLVVDSSLNVCNSYAEQGRVKGFLHNFQVECKHISSAFDRAIKVAQLCEWF